MIGKSGFSKLVSCIVIVLLTGTTAAVARPSSEPSINVTIDQPLYTFGRVQLSDGAFATIEASTAQGFTTVVGDPKLPVIRYIFEIPQGAVPVVTMTGDTWIETSLDAQGVPALMEPLQPSVVKLPGASAPFTLNAASYAVDSLQPTVTASIRIIGDIRGHRAVLLEVYPVQYNPATGALRLLTGCSLQVNLPGSNMDLTHAIIQRYSSSSFESLDQTLFNNYGSLEMGTTGQRSEGYLIIVYDQFADEIQPFADWKTTLGFETTVTLTSEIPGGPTKENIKAYISDAYNNWDVPPSFVLLVGDTGQIPTWTGSDTGTCTDLYYVTMNGDDYFADIFIGRFPAATEAQVTAMVDKTMYYEAGNFPSNDWIKKAVFMASNDNYPVSEGTHNYVIDTYLNPAGYTCDKLYCHEGATPQQVTAALNDGRSLAIYSGHGSETSWADGPPYDQSDVNALTNDGLYPFVCSHACLTCQFTVSECFGETWVRAPHKAGLAFWGATDYSYWDEDDILERNMFKAWWEDDIEFICGMTNMGLYYLYQHYGGGGMSQYYFEEYNLLGDPSVKIWRNEPNPNLPPDTPNAPTGPTQGVTFLTYTYTATVPKDPEGQQIFMMFSYGDGNTSEFMGPYSTGDQVTASYAWQHNGTFDVRVKAKDVNGSESGWSDPLTVAIHDMARFNITAVKGGFGIRVTVKNMVEENLTNIQWTVSPKAPVILYSLGMSGTIPYLAPGQETTFKTGLCAGFGRLTVTVHAGDATAVAHGFLLGPFILGLK